MPIEMRELQIKVVVRDETTTSANGGDEALRTQIGNNNQYNIDPSDIGSAYLLLATTAEDSAELTAAFYSPFVSSADIL